MWFLLALLALMSSGTGTGSSLPATCSIGDRWTLDATPSLSFECVGTNTWREVGGDIVAAIKNVNVNAANTDVATVTMPSQRYVVDKVRVTGCTTGGASSATLGVWTGAGGTGVNVIAATSINSLNTTAKYADVTPTAAATVTSTITQFFVRNVVAHGSAATCDLYVFADLVP